jgi:ferrous iron transport protein B
MGTRTIENWKDRMITIMVTPLVTCSARLPVYTLMIALVVPNKNVWWIFNYAGPGCLTAMYLYSALVSAVIVAFVMKLILKGKRARLLSSWSSQCTVHAALEKRDLADDVRPL